MVRSITAGPPGDKIRSDLRITYAPSKKTLTIDIKSKVAALYGASIQEQVKVVCKMLGVSTGHLEIDDFGAVPFVISARIEAAIKMALPKIRSEALPGMKPFCTYKTKGNRFRRSRLYIPGNQPKLMLNAGIHKPDGIILDLEDSVAPDQKFATRFVVRNALRSVDFLGSERMVRINQGELGLEDLEYIVPHNVHLILLPKVESADQIKNVDQKIEMIKKVCGRKEPVYLMPIIESGRGVAKSFEIAEASSNTVALAIGLEDYTADIGTERTKEGRESLFARSEIVNSAKAVGIQAIDTVFSDVGDEDGLRASVKEAKALGYEGKGCIHPRQIRPVHEEFAPTESEVDKAKKIVFAFNEAQKKGLGVVSLGSKMIDSPVVKRALQTVELAIANELIPKNWKKKH